jgi:hypothetical protein
VVMMQVFDTERKRLSLANDRRRALSRLWANGPQELLDIQRSDTNLPRHDATCPSTRCSQKSSADAMRTREGVCHKPMPVEALQEIITQDEAERLY